MKSESEHEFVTFVCVRERIIYKHVRSEIHSITRTHDSLELTSVAQQGVSFGRFFVSNIPGLGYGNRTHADKISRGVISRVPAELRDVSWKNINVKPSTVQ